MGGCRQEKCHSLCYFFPFFNTYFFHISKKDHNDASDLIQLKIKIHKTCIFCDKILQVCKCIGPMTKKNVEIEALLSHLEDYTQIDHFFLK